MSEEEDEFTPVTPDALHYFVDEAGDPTLFDGKGRIIVGNEGCSTHFILGKLEVENVAKLDANLLALRTRLLADPYFNGVPSMRPERGKTAVAFHAKDDPTEVRYEVFKLLTAHPLRFYAVVRDKRELVSHVQQRNREDASYRYHPNQLYDELVEGLFSKFHGIAENFHICFAERGKKDRTKALKLAIEKANRTFEQSFGFMNPSVCHVTCGTPATRVSLQAIDYFMWALQRFYEKQEDRYVKLIWPQTAEVHDIDFVEAGRRGVFYRKEKPLTTEGRIKKSGI